MRPPDNLNGLQLFTYIHRDLGENVLEPLRAALCVRQFASVAYLTEALGNLSFGELPDVLLLQVEDDSDLDAVARLRAHRLQKDLIIVLLADEDNPRWEARAKALRIQDYYVCPFDVQDLAERVQFLLEFRALKPSLEELMHAQTEPAVGTPAFKRFFDILFASVLIVLLSPVFLLAAAAIRLEGRGPVIYRSKRVGNGFRIFDFYKFRSMRPDADRLLAEMALHNQYAGGEGAGAPAFTKFKNDPRITRLGRFLRKTSIDELPQLFNILKGDMSAVGNRPLPLYEAEKLTANEWSWRFLAPAGLTGLWQVSRRGGSEMSDTERKELDNYYAKNHSMALDAKILFKTFSAIIQKENV